MLRSPTSVAGVSGSLLPRERGFYGDYTHPAGATHAPWARARRVGPAHPRVSTAPRRPEGRGCRGGSAQLSAQGAWGSPTRASEEEGTAPVSSCCRRRRHTLKRGYLKPGPGLGRGRRSRESGEPGGWDRRQPGEERPPGSRTRSAPDARGCGCRSGRGSWSFLCPPPPTAKLWSGTGRGGA